MPDRTGETYAGRNRAVAKVLVVVSSTPDSAYADGKVGQRRAWAWDHVAVRLTKDGRIDVVEIKEDPFFMWNDSYALICDACDS